MAAFVVISVALHVLMIGAIVWGEAGGRFVIHAAAEGVGANARGAPDEAVTTMFFVEDSSASAESGLEAPASAGKVLQSLRVTIVSPDSSLDDALRNTASEERPQATDAADIGEREARAALFGRYIAQIEARIERAWIRPRIAIGTDLFECHARVQQDQRRMVVEVTLQDCNGEGRWQLSLVKAIEGASPLPAPPEPNVFASTIDLHFSSIAYSPDRTEQGYEPSAIAALNNTIRSP